MSVLQFTQRSVSGVRCNFVAIRPYEIGGPGRAAEPSFEYPPPSEGDEDKEEGVVMAEECCEVEEEGDNVLGVVCAVDGVRGMPLGPDSEKITSYVGVRGGRVEEVPGMSLPGAALITSAIDGRSSLLSEEPVLVEVDDTG